MIKLELIKYKCDHCLFEAKSKRGLKTHMGHMHKDQEKTDKSPHEIEIFKCAHCEHFYNNKEELAKHGYAHCIQETIDLLIGHVQRSLNSKMPNCEIHFMTEETTLL